MQALLEEIVRRCSAGERVALCTVVGARGSTPQAAGARMLLLADGQTIGTLGGGCVEAEVKTQAIRILQARAAKLLTFKLDHDYGWDDGLICGGTMDIFVQTLQGEQAAQPFDEVVQHLRFVQRKQALLSLDEHVAVEGPARPEEIAEGLVVLGGGTK